MNMTVNAGTPNAGSVADLKRQDAFINRKTSNLAAISEGVVFAAILTAYVFSFAVA